jgi:rhodanese-related sulfurtransferase
VNIQPIDALKAEETLDILTLIDVRTVAEYTTMHAEGAINIPLDVFSDEKLTPYRGEGPIGLLCQGGFRAKTACQKLKDPTNVLIVEGGIQAWEAAALPVVHGKATISLERQVRIIAGLLVFLGVCLGSFVHPAGLFIAGFVGVGLTFAGITDTCAMAILLAKCPWNQT